MKQNTYNDSKSITSLSVDFADSMSFLTLSISSFRRIALSKCRCRGRDLFVERSIFKSDTKMSRATMQFCSVRCFVV
jgi:hypothetical protein